MRILSNDEVLMIKWVKYPLHLFFLMPSKDGSWYVDQMDLHFIHYNVNHCYVLSQNKDKRVPQFL